MGRWPAVFLKKNRLICAEYMFASFHHFLFYFLFINTQELCVLNTVIEDCHYPNFIIIIIIFLYKKR